MNVNAAVGGMTSERSGVMEVEYDTPRALPESVYWGLMSVLEKMFQFCGVLGTVDEPEILGPRSAQFRLRW